MTLEQLNEHLALLENLRETCEMREALLTKARPGAAAMTGMPHGYGVKDKVGELAVEIADLDEQIEILDRQITKSEKNLLPFIQSIRDNQTRIIFRLRFLRGLSWCEVADMIGGRNTEKSVSMICYRYLGIV